MAAAAFGSKSFRLARPLLGGLRNSGLGVQRTSPQFTCSNILSQQRRTFIQMRTNLKVVQLGGKTNNVHTSVEGEKGGEVGGHNSCISKGVPTRWQSEERRCCLCCCCPCCYAAGRCDGSEVKFDDNAAVLVNKQGEPIGTRVFGPVLHELRKKKHVKILSLAEHIA